MNDLFTSIGPNLASSMNDSWSYEGDTCPNSIEDITMNNIEVLKFLKEIDTSKSSAVPNLATKVLKPALIALVSEITYIFNLCLSTNCFPCSWKVASIVPLPKEGDLSRCTNYMPISLLPIPGKNSRTHYT